MSAFIVSHDHIDALMTFAIDRKVRYYAGQSVEITTFNATEVGAILLDENERSVNARYPNSRGNLPGTIGEDSASYKWRTLRMPQPAVPILKACSCFDYQACETPDYRASLAHTIVDAIRAAAIRVRDHDLAHQP